MNTTDLYERREDRTLADEPPTQQQSQQEVSALAVHSDPSIAAPSTTTDTDRARPTVAWVRPSDLPTLIGAPMVGRGIDLQSELVRRSRRAPVKATARARLRITRSAIARPEPTTPTGGLQL